MATESFRYMSYSNEEAFENKEGRIQLIEYAKDLAFYVSFDGNVKADFHEGEREGNFSGLKMVMADDGVFGQAVFIEGGSLTFNKNNFYNLKDKGSIQFRIKRNLTTIPYGGELFDTPILNLNNGVDNKNKIVLYHTVDSKLKLEMYDNTGEKKVDKDFGEWAGDTYVWHAFELSWNKTIAELFIDGSMVDAVRTGFVRDSGTALTISATVGTAYSFDELIVYKKQKNSEDYVVPVNALTKYTQSAPYIDIHFGSGFVKHEITDLNLNCSSNMRFLVKLGYDWYTYIGGWRKTTESELNKLNPSAMEVNFPEIPIEEHMDLIIRAYFVSDGYALAWLDEISINTDQSEAQPAFIIGTVDLTNPVDLSNEYNVVITTSEGSAEVDVSSAAADNTAVTLDEIKEAINNANIPDLIATDDGRGHLVLRTKKTGKDTFVSISEGTNADALPIIWGYEDSDMGSQGTGQYFDYTEIYRWIRSQLGAPTVPVELTDEQLQDCVSHAVFWYNYYRNAKENIVYVTLDGNVREGWKIPKEIGGEDNIIEIIMKPRFPYVFYTGRTDIVGQVYMQWFFQQHQRDLRHMAGDYYLIMSTQKDINNIMGTEIKWHFYNGRLFINPEPPKGMEIGVRFRSAVSMNEINTNVFIRDYALGKAKTILGTIRSTFGGTIPGGGEMITLRGEALIAEGKEEMENVISRMMTLTEPLGFSWG